MKLIELFSILVIITLFTHCKVDEPDTSMVIPKGDVQVGVYYFPLYSGPAELSEW
jgi:hypothetical protein